MVQNVKDVPPLEQFDTAINNIKPYVKVRSRRVGGANYQVPMQVNKRRQQSLAFRWLLAACRDGGGRPMADRLGRRALARSHGPGRDPSLPLRARTALAKSGKGLLRCAMPCAR